MPHMVRLITSYRVLAAAVSVFMLALLPGMLQLWAEDEAGSRFSAYTACSVGAAALCLLLLAGGVWLARRRGCPALPGAARLWGLLLLSAACVEIGNLYIYYGVHSFPLSLTISLPLTLGSICLLWALFRWGSLLFWWVFLILEMAQIAGYHEYGSRINSLVLAETFEASGDEALAYLTPGNIAIAAAAVVVSTIICWLMLRLLRRQRFLTLINGALLWMSAAAACAAFLPTHLREQHNYWPLGEAHLLYQSCAEAIFHNEATIRRVEQLTSPAETASTLHTLSGGEGVVLVLHIGESVRADRMSTNGYERDTTPWLRSQTELINFSNCTSAACDTCQAQIAILTDARRDIYETAPEMLPRTGSVLDLFAAHGFKTYAFFGKRNALHLKYDRVVHLLTRCAAEYYYAPGSPWTSIPQMAEVLRTLGRKQNTLIFINNEGSHTPFSHFDHDNPPFAPAEDVFHNPSAHATEVINAYDSTVHYTDEFVRRVAQLLQGRPWLYVYVSDHGEYLGHDGMWGRAGLGERSDLYHRTTGSRVGMFILPSPELEQLHPHFADALRYLRQHADIPVAHEHIFHTLLGFFDLQTPFYSPDLDLTSPSARPYSGPHPEPCREEAQDTPTPP